MGFKEIVRNVVLKMESKHEKIILKIFKVDK